MKVISLHGYLRVYCTHTVLIHLDCFCVSLVHVQCVHLSGTVEEVGRQGGSGPRGGKYDGGGGGGEEREEGERGERKRSRGSGVFLS